MEKSFYTDAGLFSADTSGLLASSDALEMENNLTLGLLERLKIAPQNNVYMLAVRNSGGAPVLAAVSTPPYNLVLSRGETAALPVLVEDLLQRKTPIPGVIGPADMVEAFIEKWHAATGQQHDPGLKIAFFAATTIDMPLKVPGALHQATDSDCEWITDWRLRFAIDSKLAPEAQKRDFEGTASKIKQGLVYIWKKDGVPVSIAGYAPITAQAVRVGAVYTPDAERGKGYASACVAHLSRHLLENGKKWCSLFADTANPVSTGIYKKIGYRERGLHQEYRFRKKEETPSP